MSGEFRHDIRVLLCDGCGGPLEVPTGGGSTTCRFCGAQVHPTPREEIDLALPGATEADEIIRLEILRAQHKKPSSVTSSLAEENFDLAFDLWKRSYGEIRASYAAATESTLAARCLDLVNHHATRVELAKGRAIVESTLEQVRSRRHVQSLRCWMARMAIVGDDRVSAEQWLARCDPRSEDLEMDTTYRVSVAALELARGDPAAVLFQLGDRGGEVPLLSAYSSLAALLRADALERLRGPEAGAEELFRAAEDHPRGWSRMLELRAMNPSRCPKSFEIAPRLLRPWRNRLLLAAALFAGAVVFGLDAFAVPRVLGESVLGSVSPIGMAMLATTAIALFASVLAARSSLRTRICATR